ncbi:MAG: hypothetical protein HY651_09480 [Acidobacteria bacterium]|nr:hypothetical protein [Acidobacteriota bacterium]
MDVKINIINIPSSGADWKRALDQPLSELPVLSKEQKRNAKDFGISEEEYARSVLSRQYTEARYRQYAEHFGTLLVETAKSHGIESAEVTYDGWDDKFHCWLKLNGRDVPLDFDADIITVPIERGDQSALQAAKRDLKTAIEWLVQMNSKKRKVASR